MELRYKILRSRESRFYGIIFVSLLGILFSSGCYCGGVSLKGKKISSMKIELYYRGQLIRPSHGLFLGEKYRLKVVVKTAGGEVIDNPNYSELSIVSPNRSVFSKISTSAFSPPTLTVSNDSVHLRKEQIKFAIKVKTTDYVSPLQTYLIRWRREVVLKYKGVDGRSGSSGMDGAPGLDQDGDNPPTDGQDGYDGEPGEPGADGPDIKAYATYIVDTINGKEVRGVLLKVILDESQVEYHYFRANRIAIISKGGDGGDGGTDTGHL